MISTELKKIKDIPVESRYEKALAWYEDMNKRGVIEKTVNRIIFNNFSTFSLTQNKK